MATLDARLFPAHTGPAALSLPARHPNGRSHAGQPTPTYNTVSLAVWPHVVIVRTPPSGTPAPRNSAYSRRAPGYSAPSPVAHEPTVYMAGCPDAAVERAGATPDVPTSAVMAGSPRHSGCVGDGDAVAAGDAVDMALLLRVAESDGVGEPVTEPDGVPVGVRVSVALPVPDRVSDALGVGVRVCDALGVGVRVCDARGVGVRVSEPLLVVLRVPLVEGVLVVVPVLLELPVPVLDGVPEPLGVGVRVVDVLRESDALPVALRVSDALWVALRVPLDDAVPVPLLVLLHVPDELPDGEPVALLVLVALLVAVGVRVNEAVAEALLVPLTLDEIVPVPVSVCEVLLVCMALQEPAPVVLLEPVPVELDDGVPVRLPVPDALLEPVPDALLEPVPVELDEGVLVSLPVLVELPEPVPLGDSVLLGVRLPDTLCRLATLRPRYVSRCTTSAGASLAPSPPAPAASHNRTDSRRPLAMVFVGTSCVTLTSR